MRLLELTRSFYPSVGGLEKFVHDRLKIYKQLNIDYKILSTDYKTEKVDSKHAELEVSFLKQFTPYNITPGIFKYLRDDYNVISINLAGRFYSDFTILFSSLKKKAKIILTPHFTFHTNKYFLIKKVYEKIILPSLLRRVDKIICFTNYEREFWQKEFKVKNDKIAVIPHYIEYENQPADIRAGNYLLYLGRVEKNKRIDLLIKAFNKIENNNFELYLTISEKNIPEELISFVKSNKKIKLLGYVSDNDKSKLLAGAAAVIYPSDFEAFGSVLLEASAFSKPILASNIGVFKEILNEDGVIFFDNTVNSICESINKFSSLSESERKKMGNVNLYNLNKYSFSNALNGYKNLFESIL